MRIRLPAHSRHTCPLLLGPDAFALPLAFLLGVRSDERGSHRKSFELFKLEVKRDAERLKEGEPAVLYVMIADECHWGPTFGGAHSRYINDKELMLAPNLLLLLVSATPYNVLTCNSRVNQQPDEAGAGNVVRWFQSGEKAETEYRSMDFYLDTVAFEVPPGLKARLRVQDGSDPPMEITLSLDVANGQGSASPPLRIASMKAIAELLNASLVQQGVKSNLLVVKFSHKTAPSLRYKFYLHRPNAPMKKTTVTLVFDEHSLWKLLGFTEEGPKELFQGDDKHDDKLIAKGDITIDSQSPNALQRIRADEGFKVLHEAFKKKFGSRTKREKDGEAKCGTKNGGAFRPCHTLAPFFSLQSLLILERRFFRLHRAQSRLPTRTATCWFASTSSL